VESSIFLEPRIGMDPDSPPPGSNTASGTDPRCEALITSLRQRFALAQARGDAGAKQALFKEAVYLNLPLELWQEPPA
jgi:hypothetical protein